MTGPLDPFRITDKLDRTALDVMTARLEARGRHPKFVCPLSAYLDRMSIDARANVLDLGCGTGVIARGIAQRPGFLGSVAGIDLSDHLVAAANQLSAEENLTGRVHFESGDCHALNSAPGSFDAVIAHTLFSHVTEPPAVLAEMRRVLAPGGIACIFDGDYASMTFEMGDDQRSRRMDDAITASLVTNPRILRQLPRLLKAAGFAVEAVLPSVITEAGTADFWKAAFEAYAVLAPRAGIISEAEAKSWKDDLLAASDQGVFFASCVYYAYVIRPV
jgi:ubiquinone/menaquinone biosynthesis C-methylase UbiE